MILTIIFVLGIIALHEFRIVATSFLMLAYNVFASGWFTALNDGKTSAILSISLIPLISRIPSNVS